ncbi:unnamed protein product, partial [Effrenium voratum]
KTLELRTFNTRFRGRVALLQSKTSQILGVAEIADVLWLTSDASEEGHRVAAPDLASFMGKGQGCYAFVMMNPMTFMMPIPVSLVRLSDDILQRIEAQYRAARRISELETKLT